MTKKYTEAEMQSNELKRIENEENRIENEAERVANEIERIAKEEIRNEFYDGFNDRLDEVNSQLAHIENNIDITPDDFEGSDVEKIQQALDYVVENNINTITLNRSYDLTGGIVYYNGKWAKPPTFKDGTLIKNDTGYMFSRLADNNNSNTPLFLNVTFIGNTENPCYIIDGDKLIRQGFDHCYFRGIGLIKTTSYLQSLRLHSCEMSFSPDIFINCSGAFDVSITNNKFEESHHSLIKSYSDSTNAPACHALRITNNLIEGYVVEPPIVLSSAYGLAISDNYFEANHCGDIEFITSNGIKTIQGVIENNSFFKSDAMWNIKSHNTGNYVNKLFLNGNISTISSSAGKSFTVGITYANMTNNSLPGGGRLVPVGKDIDTSGVQYEVINKDGYSAIKISPRTNTKSNTIDDLGQSYLVKFSGTFGSSTLYRAVFIGILTIGGNYDSDNSMVCKEVCLTHLASTLMQGNTGNASMWDSSYATVTFESTGSNKISTTDSDNIIITFNRIPYHETYSNGFVTNIEGLLAKSLYLERRMQS